VRENSAAREGYETLVDGITGGAAEDLRSRLGGHSEGAPLSVSFDEAEAALQVALHLVHAFRSGAVRRVGATL
jgi:hypothetical protein